MDTKPSTSARAAPRARPERARGRVGEGRVFWKINAYDRDLRCASVDPRSHACRRPAAAPPKGRFPGRRKASLTFCKAGAFERLLAAAGLPDAHPGCQQTG